MIKKTKLQKFHTHSLRAISYSLVFIFFFSSFCSVLSLISSPASAAELIEEAFMPAKTHEAIINLGDTKDAVGNEILRESVGLQTMLGNWCFVQGQRMSGPELDSEKSNIWYTGTRQQMCENILWGDWNVSATTSQAPLIVRITKFLLRITIVLSITMVLYSGVMYIVEASKWVDVKETTNNLMYIIGWVLLALMSLSLIQLITSLSVSSLGIQ